MKTYINYNYNLFPDTITKVDKNYYFFVNNTKFYITKLDRPIDDLPLIIEVNNKLEELQVAVYKILSNIKKEFSFEYENNIYIIMQVLKDETKFLDLNDIIKFNKLVKTRDNTLLNRNDWKKLWSEKVDYLEYQLSIIAEKDPIILDSFSYFIGLAENAISYFTDTIIEERITQPELHISHKRIKLPILKSNIYNPLNFVFDYNTRDIAEYIKIKFFKDELDWEEIESLLRGKNYSRASVRLLYARLLYPSYYFDEYEKFIIDKNNKENLKNIISKIPNYEDFLFDIYVLIKKIIPIPEIEWILKNKRV